MSEKSAREILIETANNHLPIGHATNLVGKQLAALSAAGLKILANTHRVERDWPEDRDHENGNYNCCCVECGREFTGHKRRVTCLHCAAMLTAAKD